MQEIAIVAAFVLAYGLVSRRLTTTIITGPMIFVTSGILLGPDVFDIVDFRLESELVKLLAEVTLVLILFSEAALLDWPTLRRNRQVPLRLLGIGLPLTIVLGAALALVLFGDLDLWQAALIAAVLAPTDAALGQAVVTNPRVPVRIREGLGVEGGLNDGIVAPLVTGLIAAVAISDGSGADTFWIRYLVKEVGYGLLIGAGFGVAGTILIVRSHSAGWMSDTFRQISIAALPIFVYAMAVTIDGNGFIAAFVAGIVFGNLTRHVAARHFEFAEQTSQILLLVTFMMFGGLYAIDTLDMLTWQIALYGVLSLVLVRPVAVAISMAGAKFRPSTVGFMAWFGPRGLASIVFALLVLETDGVPGQQGIFLIASWTVLLSVFAHGLTAKLGADWYASHADTIPEEAPELDKVERAFRSAARVLGGKPLAEAPGKTTDEGP